MRTPEATDFRAYGVRVSLYELAPGEGIERHKHYFAHKLAIARGTVIFTKELHERTITAPCEMEIDQCLEHEVIAVTRAVVISIFNERGEL